MFACLRAGGGVRYAGGMRSITKLFGKSPFEPIQTHIEHVARTVAKGQALLDAYLVGDQQTVEHLAEEIDKLEGEADRIKHRLETELRGGTFLAVERGRLRQLITVQDSIADKMQNLARLTTLRACDEPPAFADTFRQFLQLNLETFDAIRSVIDALDEMTDGGASVDGLGPVFTQIDRVAQLEGQADDLQHALLKELFAVESMMSPGEFFLWTKIFKQVADIGNRSNRLGNRLRTTLQIK